MSSARLLCTLLDPAASGKLSLSQRLKREPIRQDVMELIDELGLGMQRRGRKLSKAELTEAAEEERRQRLLTRRSNVLARMGLKKALDTADGAPRPKAAEIAFAGRSNVGKSSLLNALTGKICGKTGTIGVAAVGNRPGVTRSLNFYSNPMGAQLVDLPGYGYAQASEEETARWQAEMRAYLAQRGHGQHEDEAGGTVADFLRVILVIDARQAMKQTDRDFLLWLDREARVPLHVVMSKCDLVQRKELCRRYTLLGSELAALSLRHHVAPHHMISSKTGAGVDLLRAALTSQMPSQIRQKTGAMRERAERTQRADEQRREYAALEDQIATPAAREFAVRVRRQQQMRQRDRLLEAKRRKPSDMPEHMRRERQRAAAYDLWARRAKARAPRRRRSS